MPAKTKKKSKKKAKPTTKKKITHRRPLSLAAVDTSTTVACCENSAIVLRHAFEAANALLTAYNLARDQRGRRRGMTTDQEQDLLRAMLVMAAAGLDSMSKQLIRDALTELLSTSKQALNTFEKFISRRLGEGDDSVDRVSANKFLARVLSRPSPQDQLIEEYINDLTRGSLQSTEALFQVAAALGIDPPEAGIDPNTLTPIFKTRNSIVHELDINLKAQRRNRHVRGQTAMIRDTNKLLSLSENILRQVDELIRPSSS